MDESAIPLQAPASACNNSIQTDTFEQCINLQCTVQEALSSSPLLLLNKMGLMFSVTKNASETVCGRSPRDRTKSVSVTGIVGLSIATMILLLRVISRIRNHQFGMDDGAMIMAMVI